MLKRVDDDDSTRVSESPRVSDPPQVTEEDPDKKQKKWHNKACEQLNLTFGKMNYIVRRLLPEKKDLLSAAEMAKQRIARDSMPDALKANFVLAGDKQITSLQQEIKALHVEYGRLRFEEDELLPKLVDEKRRNEDGFNTVPCLLECEKCYELEADPVSKALVSVTLTDAEKERAVEDLMRECNQYYDDNKETIRSLIEEPKRKKVRVTTGTPREFEVADHVMVHYPKTGWHEGIVTNYFSTSQAKGNKAIKAGYVVDFIATKEWENGLQPKKGKKMRSPDEEEEELFADVDAAAIVEEVKDRFAT